MNFEAVKEKLHGFIENANHSKIMAMYTLIEGNLDEGKVMYTDDELKNLEERSENAFSGKSKTYTLEESMERIKKRRKTNEV